jgi:hypothetical protein
MKTNISNVDDLKARIVVLKSRRFELESDFQQTSESLTEKLRIPSMIYNKVTSWVSSFGSGKPHTGKGEPDWMTNLFKVGLPMIVNRFLFPSSGIVMKAILALVSQRAAKTVNLDVFTGVFDKVKHWMTTPAKSKPRQPVMRDYGIPPDSETF